MDPKAEEEQSANEKNSGTFKKNMAAPNNLQHKDYKTIRNQSSTACIVSHESVGSPKKTVIFNPDFFVERLRHDCPQAFTDLVLSNITRLIDLPGEEFAQLTGEAAPRLPSHTGFLRSFNFLKRKDKGVVFGAPLTEEGIAQIYQLIEYLSKNLHVEGLFRVPGHSLRQAALREMLNTGEEIDLEAGDFHPNDAATLLKAYLGEMPEPLLTHRHYQAHLKIGELTRFDDEGNKTDVPDKERRIEAFQLLFMLLPPANRSFLKLLLDLLYHTARNQHVNKMSAINLATMFAPHIIWPKNMTASSLHGNVQRLNNGVAFLIKHSQKLFRAPVYMKEYSQLIYTGSRNLQSQDDLALCAAGSGGRRTQAVEDVVPESVPAPSTSVGTGGGAVGQNHTAAALRELYQQVSSMPESAKKKKLIRQFEKEGFGTPVPDPESPFSRNHRRARSFGGIMKRRVLGSQTSVEKRHVREVFPGPHGSPESQGKENVSFDS